MKIISRSKISLVSCILTSSQQAFV